MKGPKISSLKYSLPHHNLLKNIPRFVFSSLYVCCTDGKKRWKKLWKGQWVQRKRSQRKEWHRNLETEVIRIFERQRRELGTVPLNNVAFASRKMSKNFLVFVCALQCNSLFCYFLKISFNTNHDLSEAPEARFVFPLGVSLCLPAGTQKVPCPQSILHVSPVPLLTNLLPISIIENSLSRALVYKVDFMEDFMVESQEMVLHIMDNFITKCPLGRSSPRWSPGLPAAQYACLYFSICFSLLPLPYVPPELQLFQTA